MKDLERHFKIAFDSVAQPIVFVDKSGSVLFANRTFKSEANQGKEELPHNFNIKSVWPSVTLPIKPGTFSEKLLLGAAGAPVEKTLAISEISDGILMLQIQSEAGALVPSKAFHSQRVETLGVLAGGIAHDFNNILTGLLGHVTYLKTILPRAGSHLQSLAALEEGARKASTLTQEILNFSRADAGDRPSKVEVADIIRRTYNLLRGAISPEYEINLSLPEHPIYVLADESKIAQILVNLVMNARDAAGSSGKIEISLANAAGSPQLADIFGCKELSAANYACISVKDFGHGMDAEVLNRIFEPYYSTKRGKGTGLGLAIVKDIVNLFAGAINVKSKLKQGTEVSIYLPVLEGSVSVTSDSLREQESLAGGQERILVVDDEYPVRNVLSLSLEHLGYKVEIAASGTEALEKYADAGKKFDLVILDMLMPNLSGDETFFKLKKIDPSVRVLVISGYTSEEVVQNILDNGGLGFVQKPFTIHELAKRVRQCLD